MRDINAPCTRFHSAPYGPYPVPDIIAYHARYQSAWLAISYQCRARYISMRCTRGVISRCGHVVNVPRVRCLSAPWPISMRRGRYIIIGTVRYQARYARYQRAKHCMFPCQLATCKYQIPMHEKYQCSTNVAPVRPFNGHCPLTIQQYLK